VELNARRCGIGLVAVGECGGRVGALPLTERLNGRRGDGSGIPDTRAETSIAWHQRGV
jgi:hypothetical protein